MSAVKSLQFMTRPAMLTGLAGSVALMLGAMWVWSALGSDIRSRVTVLQAGTLVFFVLLMVAMMLSIGFSKVWADGNGVTTRNVFRVRTHPLSEVLGVRLRHGDPWAYLLVRDPDSDEPKRHAILAIQSLEGERGMNKVLQLRKWLDDELGADDQVAEETADDTAGDDSPTVA